MKKQCRRAQLSRWYSMTGSYSDSQDVILPLSPFTERWSVLKIVKLFAHKIVMTAMANLQYILLQLSSTAISSFFLGFSRWPPLISRLALSSKWFSNLPTLGQASNWISKFLPTNREHRISSFALCHDNSQFILCRAQIVVGLITKTDLVQRTV